MIETTTSSGNRIEWFKYSPYFILHAGCLAVFWVGTSKIAITLALALYLARMFFITGFYHRYFSHRAFKTSRLAQFIFAFLGCTAGQRGPIWWAAHHRHHHRLSDRPDDTHSPYQGGWIMSHAGWFMQTKNQSIRERYVQDWQRYPELVWLEKWELLPFLLLAIGMVGAGWIIGQYFPGTETSAMQLFVWFLISTVAVYHGTYTINSLCHIWGSRRFETDDHSRNNPILALITLGEGWHNNHHWYPMAAQQGLKWWEIDITYYLLRLMAALGLIWDLRSYPKSKLASYTVNE